MTGDGGSDPADALRRWEAAGGVWRVLAVSGSTVTVSLCTCTGGEEVDRVVSAAPELAAYLAGRSRSDD